MKVIIDCDTGSDDAWAIIALLQSEARYNFKVIAITCVNGNTSVQNSVQNTLKVLEVCGRLDVPVYAGAQSSIITTNSDQTAGFHGHDGLNDIKMPKPTFDLAQKDHAVTALMKIINQNPKNIAIISLAPLTNIALLYKLHPDVIDLISSLHVMGGNHMGVGNTTKHAEFNFFSDPEAAHVVFAESTCEIVVFPWEPCMFHSLLLPFDEWRVGKLSSNGNRFTRFLDPIEIVAYKDFDEWMPCDLFLAATFIVPKIVRVKELHHVSIELAGNHTRGMMVMDHLKRVKANAVVVTKIDVEMFKNFVMGVCGHGCGDNGDDGNEILLNGK
jgi:inosine-uridine nucleoside N-ribohydrolase